MSSGKPKFKLVVIAGRNQCDLNKKCGLRHQDRVSWVNPTKKNWWVRFFGTTPISRKRKFKVTAGEASPWYHVKKGLTKGTIFRYTITETPGGGGPNGPAIISEGG